MKLKRNGFIDKITQDEMGRSVKDTCQLFRTLIFRLVATIFVITLSVFLLTLIVVGVYEQPLTVLGIFVAVITLLSAIGFLSSDTVNKGFSKVAKSELVTGIKDKTCYPIEWEDE